MREEDHLRMKGLNVVPDVGEVEAHSSLCLRRSSERERERETS